MTSIVASLQIKFPALKYANFRMFLLGQGLSLIGTWMQRAAQQWLVYEMTKSPFLLGLVGVFQFTPMLVLSVFAGVFVDRFPKKRLIMFTQVVQMLQALILAGLVLSGRIQYGHILVMAFVLGLVNTFDMPTRQSFFIELVGKEDLKSAIGLNSSIVNLGRIVGPAVGGLVLSIFGAGFCFLLNGLSFIAVLLSLHKIKTYEIHVRAKGKNILAEVHEGLKYVRHNKRIFNAVWSMFIVGTIAMNNDVLIPVMAKDVLHEGPRGYSFLLSFAAMGSLAGALTFAGKKKALLGKNTLLKSAVLIGLALVVAGLSKYYMLTVVSLMTLGFFNMVFMATVNSTIQLNATDEFRGRAMGVYSLVFNGTTPIGNAYAGAVAQHFGPGMGFITCGVLTMGLMGLYYGVREKEARMP